MNILLQPHGMEDEPSICQTQIDDTDNIQYVLDFIPSHLRSKILSHSAVKNSDGIDGDGRHEIWDIFEKHTSLMVNNNFISDINLCSDN